MTSAAMAKSSQAGVAKHKLSPGWKIKLAISAEPRKKDRDE
jgi:hypothetical protein